MSEVPKISTSKYTKKGKVNVDGNLWEIVLPGAGSELRFSQASRACKLYAARIQMLDKKIDNQSISETELDNYEIYSKKYEENELIVYGFFVKTFTDGTKDNASVKKWVDETPSDIITRAFEDVRDQSAARDEDGTVKPETD